jgi:hypothetical protein
MLVTEVPGVIRVTRDGSVVAHFTSVLMYILHHLLPWVLRGLFSYFHTFIIIPVL